MAIDNHVDVRTPLQKIGLLSSKRPLLLGWMRRRLSCCGNVVVLLLRS